MHYGMRFWIEVGVCIVVLGGLVSSVLQQFAFSTYSPELYVFAEIIALLSRGLAFGCLLALFGIINEKWYLKMLKKLF